MGRTVLPYSHVLESERERWKPFRRALRKEDREAFDRLFDRAKFHTSSGKESTPKDDYFYLKESKRDAHNRRSNRRPRLKACLPRSKRDPLKPEGISNALSNYKVGTLLMGDISL